MWVEMPKSRSGRWGGPNVSSQCYDKYSISDNPTPSPPLPHPHRPTIVSPYSPAPPHILLRLLAFFFLQLHLTRHRQNVFTWILSDYLPSPVRLAAAMAAALHYALDQRPRSVVNNSSRYHLAPSPLSASGYNPPVHPPSPPTHIMQPPLHAAPYYTASALPPVTPLSFESPSQKAYTSPPSDYIPQRYVPEPPLPPSHLLPHPNLHSTSSVDPYSDQLLLDPPSFTPIPQVHEPRQRDHPSFYDAPIPSLSDVQQPLGDISVPNILPSYDHHHEDKLSLRPVKDLSLRDHHQPAIIHHASQRIPHQLPPLPPPHSQLQHTSTLVHKSERQFAEQPQHFSLSVPDCVPLTTVDDSAAIHPTYINSSLSVPAMFGSDSTPSAAHYASQHAPPVQNVIRGNCSTHSYLANQLTMDHVVYSVGEIRPGTSSVCFAQQQHPTLAVQSALSEDPAGTTTVHYVQHPNQHQAPLLLSPLQTQIDHSIPQSLLPSADLGLHPLIQSAGNVANIMGDGMSAQAVGTIAGSSTAAINVPEFMGTPQLVIGSEMVDMDMYLRVGRVCRDIGRLDLAANAFRACMALCPESTEARAAYTTAVFRQGYEAGIEMGAVFPEDIFNNVGNSLRTIGRASEAEMAYRAALSISPRHANAWNNLGNAMRARGAVTDAMQCYTYSLLYQSGFAAAHCNLAGLLRDQGKPQEAEAQYRAALLSDPDLAEAAAGLGTALRDMGRTEEAVPFYVRAVTLQPSAADHHANLANTYKDLNRIEESIVSYQAALSLQPDLPDAFCNMVHSLSVICDWRHREQNFATLLAIIDRQLDTLMNHPATTSRLYNTLVGALSNSTPQLIDACGGSRSDRDGVSVSTSIGREEDSTERHPRRRYIHHPSSPTVVKKARMRGKFAKFITSAPAVVAPVLTTGLPSVQPFHALIYPMSPEKFRALSAAFAARAEAMVAGIPHVTQRWTVPRGSRPRLKVGYVSSDYNNHPYSHLTQSIYGLHSTGAVVECYCYALTPSDQSGWRQRIEVEAEHFRDISGMTAKQSAEAIANDGIHVLINCNGYTKGARTELFALRPAPVQVSFMGFPGTLGAHYIEYFITDVVTSPPELASRMHSEALLYHPHSYFVNDHKQTSIPGPTAYPSGPLTRAHYGLPENCFLFIMHNQLYKLSPDTFDVWARILNRVPGSKLWLLRFPPTGEQRIRDEAAARGLAADRLIFTDVAGKEEHVARAGLGDLFLDTPTCNAHTTGTDVLWSGVPMITCPGSLFASRVAASLLTAAGLPELVAKDMLEYEDLAVELATNRAKLSAIRAKIELSRFTNALFDTERWVRNVEALYWQAWRNFEAGKEPGHIFGKDVYDGSTMVQRPMFVESHYSTTDSRRSETLIYGNMYNSTVAT